VRNGIGLFRSLSAYLKQSPSEKIPLHTMRQDLARGLVMARSGIPIPLGMSFYPVFRQTPKSALCYLKMGALSIFKAPERTRAPFMFDDVWFIMKLR